MISGHRDTYEPRSKENDDKDERCRLQDQFSSIELLDGRLDLFLFGGVVPVRKIATHLGEREVFSVFYQKATDLFGKGVVSEQRASSSADLG